MCGQDGTVTALWESYPGGKTDRKCVKARREESRRAFLRFIRSGGTCRRMLWVCAEEVQG